MILSLALTTVWLLGPAAEPAQESAEAPAKHAAEDVEVMRRLLVKELGELAPAHAPEEAADGFTTSYAQGVWAYSLGGRNDGVTHARGFVVPGVGAVFTIDLELPVYETEPGASSDEREDDDAWEQARREVQSGGGFKGAVAVARTKTYRIDPQALDAAIDRVVETLASHGNRIRGLGPGESITVLLNASSSGRFRSRPQVIAPAAAGEGTLFWSSGAPLLTLSAPDVRVVVRLPLAVLRDYVDDRIGRGSVAERAAITRY